MIPESNNQYGWSMPFLLIIVICIAVLTIIFGLIVLVLAAVVFLSITLMVLISDKIKEQKK